jgi:hypothetical protein
MAKSLDWIAPDACTLPTAEQPLRVAEFDALFAESLDHAVRDDTTHARLELAGEADLADRARDLAQRETACCSFFEFDVQVPGPGRVNLDIRVPANRADVLEALVERAEAVRSTGGLR